MPARRAAALLLAAGPAGAAAGYGAACIDAATRRLPFCDTSLPTAARVADLVSRLNLTEKIGLLGADGIEIGRLGIPRVAWGQECLHGVVVGYADPQPPGATVFPQPLAAAASFDSGLLRAIGEAVSDEARALNNAGDRGAYLSCWAPNINIFRDPRWGRGAETYGEDPALTSELLRGFVAGLQGDHPEYLKLVATPKHYAAYSLEEADGESRSYFDARVAAQDWADTYLPPWRAAVGAGAASVMCSYNAVNGVPSCVNRHMQTDVLRGELGFGGFVVSDCSAIENVVVAHRYNATLAAAAAEGVGAGCDVDCGQAYGSALPDAVAQGLLPSGSVDDAAARVLRARFRLGSFDPPERNPWRGLNASEVVGSAAHSALALRAAQAAVVLLKHDAAALPLRRGAAVALLGASADDAGLLLGNYHGAPPAPPVTPLAALRARGVAVTHAPGVWVTGEGSWAFDAAITAARAADVAVVVLGSSSKGTFNGTTYYDTVEKESMDRRDIALPGLQEDFLKALAARTATPIVVVLIGGGPLAVEWAARSPRVAAMLFAGYGGQRAGDAIAGALLGEFSPSGRLPVTWYHANYTQQVRAGDMSMRGWPGRTHRFLQVPALYPFAYGLSYARWEYGALAAAGPAALARGAAAPLRVSLTVRRAGGAGPPAAEHTVPLFRSYVGPDAGEGGDGGLRPVRDLHAVRRVRLDAGEGDTVHFDVAAADLALADRAGARRVAAGRWRLVAGGAAPGDPRAELHVDVA